jgi:hypothetical protein
LNARESDNHDCVPLSPDTMSSLALLTGPDETHPEHEALERRLGFGYWQVAGELTYAFVLWHLNIGLAVTFLACFVLAPHHDHYLLFTIIARRIINWLTSQPLNHLSNSFLVLLSTNLWVVLMLPTPLMLKFDTLFRV